MFVYRGGDDEMAAKSPEELQKVMQGWWDWIQTGVDEGWMVDGGDALTPEGRVVHPDSSITDGPFTESKEVVGGYTMIQADSFDAACQHAKSCPIMLVGGTVEVRQLAEVGKDES